MTDTTAHLPPEPTLDEIRAGLAPRIAVNATFDGWGDTARDAAAADLGIDGDVARLAFIGGPVAMIDAWFAAIDRQMADRLPPDTLAAMKVRARIQALVETRLDLLAPDVEALRRALSILALPANVARAPRLAWRSADVMWRLAGDDATDINHYTKRLTLAGVYGSTIAVFVGDESEGQVDTRAFLARRIDQVMAFEKLKGRWRDQRANRPSLARFVGRLRYPAR